jgi:hypothetical protein
MRIIVLLIAVVFMSGCGWFPLPKCLQHNPPPMELPKDYQDYEEMRYDYWRDKKIHDLPDVGLPQDYKDAAAWQDDEDRHR